MFLAIKMGEEPIFVCVLGNLKTRANHISLQHHATLALLRWQVQHLDMMVVKFNRRGPLKRQVIR